MKVNYPKHLNKFRSTMISKISNPFNVILKNRS